MRNLRTICLVLAGLAAIAGAQSLPSSPHLDLVHRGAFLLADARVQSRIGLSGSQLQSVQQIIAEHSERQTRQLQSADADPNAMAAADKAASAQILRALNPAQLKALKRATFRAAGYPALLEPEVAKQLGLKPVQKTKIANMLRAANAPVVELEEIIAHQLTADPTKAAELRDAYRSERANRAKAKAAAEAKVLTVLNSAQLQIWKGLAG